MAPEKALKMISGRGIWIPSTVAERAIKQAFNEGIEITKAQLVPEVKYTAEEAFAAICTVFNTTNEELIGRNRKGGIKEARKALAYLLYNLIQNTVATGEIMGGRDHSTVTYLVQAYKDSCYYDRKFREKVAQLETILNPSDD